MFNLCVIANKYPNPLEPNVLVFVQQLVWSMADQGIECSVICPVPVNLDPRYLLFPYARTEETEHGRKVAIYHPKYIGFGQSRLAFGIRPAPLTVATFSGAVITAINQLKRKPDALYGHFLVTAGVATARAGRVLGIPAFVAYGESTIKTIDEFGARRLAREFASLAGVISVSSENQKRLLSFGVVDANRVGVFPNGYRSERFYPRDRMEARRRFGFPADAFIVGMAGSFDERKGVLRIQQAVDELEGVLFACAGQGRCTPDSVKCIHNKTVENCDMPFFLSALDAFVLPTLNEGCSNAIVEAMASGLPIVSSNRAFNQDILDATNAILVDPENIDAIRGAILTLRDQEATRRRLAAGSLEKAKGLTLKKRAEDIMEFIRSRIPGN